MKYPLLRYFNKKKKQIRLQLHVSLSNSQFFTLFEGKDVAPLHPKKKMFPMTETNLQNRFLLN